MCNICDNQTRHSWLANCSAQTVKLGCSAKLSSQIKQEKMRELKSCFKSSLFSYIRRNKYEQNTNLLYCRTVYYWQNLGIRVDFLATKLSHWTPWKLEAWVFSINVWNIFWRWCDQNVSGILLSKRELKINRLRSMLLYLTPSGQTMYYRRPGCTIWKQCLKHTSQSSWRGAFMGKNRNLLSAGFGQVGPFQIIGSVLFL